MRGSASTLPERLPVYGLAVLSPRVLSTLSVILAILVSLRALSPSREVGYIIDVYYVVLVLASILMVLSRSGLSARIFMRPDVSAMLVSSLYALSFGGYVPIMVSLFTLIIVLSSRYVEETLGHAVFLAMGPRRDLGYIEGQPGSSVKLYPGAFVAGDFIISRGSIVVREPYNSDSRSYREAGDLVAGYSTIESGSAEALIVRGGSLFSGGTPEISRASERICSIFSALVYVVTAVGAVAGHQPAVFLSIAAPSIPYILSLYIARRTSDLAGVGIISWQPIMATGDLCSASNLYIRAGSAIYAPSAGEVQVKSRSSLGRDELMRIVCSADSIEAVRGLCRGYEGRSRVYEVVRRGQDLVILEDARTRLRICISTPERARVYGFQWDITPIDPGGSCRGTVYVVSTRHEVLGYICVNRAVSISNILSLSKISRDYRVTLIVEGREVEGIARVDDEAKKILEGVELRIQSLGAPACPEKGVLKIDTDIPSHPCRRTVYMVDPKQASKRYNELRTGLMKGATATLRRDISWVEKLPGLCRRWGRDLLVVVATYAILRGGGAIVSISTGMLWAQYVLEVASYALSMLRLYSR